MLAQGDGGRLGAVRGFQLLEERYRVLPHGGRRDAEFLRDKLCAVKHLAYQLAVGRLHVHDGRNVALGHHQKVHRGLRGNVVEGEHVVVFVDFLGRDFTLDDFAEKTVFTHSDYKVVKRKAARFLEGAAVLLMAEGLFGGETGAKT